MDKVIVRTKALSQALFNLAVADCETIEVSVVMHALRVEGIREGVEPLVLHIWSKDAEDTEASVGAGEKLTEEEVALLDKGECPKCQKQLRKGSKEGLAINVSCEDGHCFWVPPAPFTPEYLGQPELEEEKKAQAEEAVAVSEAEPQVETEGKAFSGTATNEVAEQAIKALEEGEGNE